MKHFILIFTCLLSLISVSAQSVARFAYTAMTGNSVSDIFSTSKLDGSISMDVSSLAAGQYVVSLVDCSSGSDVILATTRLVVV